MAASLIVDRAGDEISVGSAGDAGWGTETYVSIVQGVGDSATVILDDDQLGELITALQVRRRG